MNWLKIESNNRLVWTVQAVSETLGISEASARVLCSRYVRSNLFLRLRRNLYILKTKADQLSQADLFRLSALIQTPSCVSFMTALSWYGVTTQLTRGVIEAVSPTRSKGYSAGPWLFAYSRFRPEQYFGFGRQDTFFIATPEKALMDCLYMESIGRYALDRDSLDLGRLSVPELKKIASRFPARTRQALNKLLNDAGIKTA